MGERVVQAGEVRLARIESLRALAALAVLAGHLWVVSQPPDAEVLVGSFWRRALYGGGFGVFVFFALSGYLLFWPFVRRHFGAGDAIDLRRYARNRALRVLPLYFFAVVALLVVQNAGGTPELWWRHLLLVQAAWRDSINAVDGSLWSVAVEIEFYVLLPALAAALAWVSRGSRAGAAAILLALGAASELARRRLAGANGDLWGYQLPTTFLYFTGGMLVALLRAAWEERRPAWLDGPLGASTLWVAASLPLWAVVVWRFDRQELIAPAAFLLVGALALPLRGGRAVAALEWRPLVALGVASYSLYVWHLPILEALDVGGFVALTAIGTPLCVLAAFVSYGLVETPGLRLRRRWSPATARQVGADETTADRAPAGRDQVG